MRIRILRILDLMIKSTGRVSAIEYRHFAKITDDAHFIQEYRDEYKRIIAEVKDALVEMSNHIAILN